MDAKRFTRKIDEVATEFKLQGEAVRSFKSNAVTLLGKKDSRSMQIFVDSLRGKLPETLALLAFAERFLGMKPVAERPKPILHPYHPNPHLRPI
jgi:hypothetical protein